MCGEPRESADDDGDDSWETVSSDEREQLESQLGKEQAKEEEDDSWETVSSDEREQLERTQLESKQTKEAAENTAGRVGSLPLTVQEALESMSPEDRAAVAELDPETAAQLEEEYARARAAWTQTQTLADASPDSPSSMRNVVGNFLSSSLSYVQKMLQPQTKKAEGKPKSWEQHEADAGCSLEKICFHPDEFLDGFSSDDEEDEEETLGFDAFVEEVLGPDEDACITCCDGPQSVEFPICGHRVICRNCAYRLQKKEQTEVPCPVCRQSARYVLWHSRPRSGTTAATAAARAEAPTTTGATIPEERASTETGTGAVIPEKGVVVHAEEEV